MSNTYHWLFYKWSTAASAWKAQMCELLRLTLQCTKRYWRLFLVFLLWIIQGIKGIQNLYCVSTFNVIHRGVGELYRALSDGCMCTGTHSIIVQALFAICVYSFLCTDIYLARDFSELYFVSSKSRKSPLIRTAIWHFVYINTDTDRQTDTREITGELRYLGKPAGNDFKTSKQY